MIWSILIKNNFGCYLEIEFWTGKQRIRKVVTVLLCVTMVARTRVEEMERKVD